MLTWEEVLQCDDLEFCGDPTDIGGGRIHFTVPFGHVTIFPKGGSKLDPHKVRGLQIDSA